MREELRLQELVKKREKSLDMRVDTLFRYLFMVEWVMGIVLASYNSPTSWNGSESVIHPHIWAAFTIGTFTASYAIYVTTKNCGDYMNRFVVAIAQMIFSTLFIHFTGGRIETHFHIFGSLAFIAFYRDYKPVLAATLFTALDHLLAVTYWPEAMYGSSSVTVWRAIEHAAWVVFEDVFLFIAIIDGKKEIKINARQQAQLEIVQSQLEQMIETRTAELDAAKETVLNQQKSLVHSAKLSALGEMAGGIAHEINNPLSIITLSCETLNRAMTKEVLNKNMIKEVINNIQITTERIAKIVKGLKTISRNSDSDDFVFAPVAQILDDSISLCGEKLKNHDIQLMCPKISPEVKILCNPTAISQVILNLIGNAADAIDKHSVKWIKIDFETRENEVVLSITDSGNGIPKAVLEKIMLPFFTTKEVGKGTGLGLSISKGIIESHKGMLQYDENCNNTRFMIKLPNLQMAG